MADSHAHSGCKYTATMHLSHAAFRRLTGVTRTVFRMMVRILKAADKQKRKRGGRKDTKLCVEDKLLLALEYLREYRTYFHVGQSYGVSESSAFKTHRWVEDTLIKDKCFHLPGKKALVGSDIEYEVILMDGSETAIERPKKVSGATTPARRSDTPSKLKSLFPGQ